MTPTFMTLIQTQFDFVPDNIFISSPNLVPLKLLSGDPQTEYVLLKIKHY